MKQAIANIADGLKSLLKHNMGQIAVIIPVYNVTSYLEKTIRSVTMQNYAYKEIIVIDDGSSDEAAGEIKRICALFQNVTLLQQAHTGPAAARSTGVSYTKAEHIVFLDGDDILCPGALQFFAAALHKNPDADAVYGRIKYINERDDVTGRREIETPSGIAVLYNILERLLCFCNGSICIRKEALETLSVNNHTMKYGEDWVLWCHLALRGNIIFAGNRVVLYYRLHLGGVTAALPEPENYASVIAAHESVYNDPVFIHAVGTDKLDQLREKCLCRLHMTLAGTCSMQSRLKEAEYYFNKANMSVDSLHRKDFTSNIYRIVDLPI